MADDQTEGPGANPGDLASEKGGENGKSREVAGGKGMDPQDVADRMKSTGKDTGNA